MASLLDEILDPSRLLGAGGTLVFVGGLLWIMPRLFKGMLAYRRDYAAKLRASGEEERARRLDAETASILRRAPIYGRVLLGSGVVVIVAAVITSR